MKTMHNHPNRKGAAKSRKTELFLLVPDTDDTPVFSRVTDDIGKSLADVYEKQRTKRSADGLPQVALPKPAAVCAMRVSTDIVAFTLLRLSKQRVKAFMTDPLSLPVAALARVERTAPELMGDTELVLEVLVADPDAVIEAAQDALTQAQEKPEADSLGDLFDEDDEAATPVKRAPRATKPVRWTLTYNRDDAGVVSIDDDGEILEKTGGPMKVAVYLKSPLVGRILGVSYMGFFPGKPDQPETKARVAAQVLHLAGHLGEFRALAGFEDVRVPPRPSSGSNAGNYTAQTYSAQTEMPLALFATPDDLMPFSQGKVKVTVDLQSASDRLLYHIVPDEALAPHFEPYRHVAIQCVTQQMEAALGPDTAAAVRAEIILGELTTDTVATLRVALKNIEGGSYLTTSRWAPMNG
jgi:hypothetical protein